jgi:ketosteroid isomerase-like protein
MTARRPETHRRAGAMSGDGGDSLRPMSEENVAAVRSIIPPPEVDLTQLFRDDRLFEATAAALAEVTDPELECEAVWHEGRTYTGIEGVRQLWLDWLEPWTEYHSEAEETIDAGDRVLVFAHDRGRRHDTDLEVEIFAGSVWELRDGRVVRVKFFRDREETLAAAGLSEEDLRRQ